MKLNFWKSSEKTVKDVKLIVGLGNPGKEYAGSLHNVGFMCVNYFARQHKISFDRARGKARTGTGKAGGVDVVVARPQTFMNRSGESVKKLVNSYKVELGDLLVIYDDMDLPFGKVRIRAGGSAGGHNGIKSIIHELGSQEFPRLRVGIGRPDGTKAPSENEKTDVITYLLSSIPEEDRKEIDNLLPTVNEAILSILTEGVTAAMNRFNSNESPPLKNGD